jgi:hypothetical protein
MIPKFRETFIARDDNGDELEITQGYDGVDFYTEVSGRRIAVRGDGKWVSVVPGWKVETSPDYETMTVSYLRRCAEDGETILTQG